MLRMPTAVIRPPITFGMGGSTTRIRWIATVARHRRFDPCVVDFRIGRGLGRGLDGHHDRVVQDLNDAQNRFGDGKRGTT